MVKYLRYALGEIILIVIGIMIALQVNAWNQRRILRDNIAQYTNSLKVDLAQDTVLISSRLKLMVADTTKLGNFRDRMSAPGVTKDTLVHIARYEFHPVTMQMLNLMIIQSPVCVPPATCLILKNGCKKI